MFEGRKSPLEGDSSDDVEEEDMQDADIEELMGWPLELLLVPHEERRARKKRRAAAPHAGIEREGGRDTDVSKAERRADAQRRLSVGVMEQRDGEGEEPGQGVDEGGTSDAPQTSWQAGLGSSQARGPDFA
jgi:hypothetical protein